MKQNKTYQAGASHERQTIVAYARRRMRELKKVLGIGSRVYTEMEDLVLWLQSRTKRFNKVAGGLGRKRKAAK